jgi:hypothetical protein
MTFWSSSRSEILLKAIKNSNYDSKIEYSPDNFEESVNRLQNLFFEIRNHFQVDEMYICPSIEQLDHLIYDNAFYEAIMDFLNSDTFFQYIVHPELSDLQLDTIRYAIETMSRFMNLDQPSRLFIPTDIKEKIIIELSKNYDVANDRFISFYQIVFDDLSDNLKDESNVNPKKVDKIRHDIVNYSLDTHLFTRLIIFIRSQMVNQK